MGIVVGATSGKFVMVASMLLFQVRVDGDPVPAAIVPGSPKSMLSARVERHLRSHGGPTAPIKVGIRGDYFYAAVDLGDAGPSIKADLVIGQDILSDHPIEIDFRRHELASLLPGELRARQRHDHAITLRPDGAGHWHVALGLPDGGTIDAILDLASPEPVVLGSGADRSTSAPDAVIALGGTAIPNVRLWRSALGSTTVGLGVFENRRIVFDLAHNRIWIDV